MSNAARFLVSMLLFAFIFSFAGKKRIEIKPWPAPTLKSADESRLFEEFSTDLDGTGPLPYSFYEKSVVAPVAKKKAAYKAFPYESEEVPEVFMNLVSSQSPVKNQKSRGQCHNFAVTAAMEYSAWAGDKAANNFSEQCNAWKFFRECEDCCLDPSTSDDGGWPDVEVAFVKDKFMKYEKDYSYSTIIKSRCKDSYNDKPYYQFKDIVTYDLDTDRIREALSKNFVVLVSTLWKYKGWNDYGEYPYSDTYDKCDSESCGAHAILIVGYDDNYFGNGMGGYIFKNSWGTSWSKKTDVKPEGYGVFPYTYLRKFGYGFTAVSHATAVPSVFPAEKGCAEARKK